MEKLIVAVGSARRPKLDAVREALDLIVPRFHGAAQFEIAAVDVPSGVRHTPLSREETMAGARQRAEAVARIGRERREPWQYFIGLEGGLDLVHQSGSRWVFLENWAYVADASGRGAFGQSGAVLLPEPLVQQVVDRGVELAEAIDDFAQGQGIRDAQGAWGVLTRDIVTRRDAIRISVVSAFAALLGASTPSDVRRRS
ncbi:MAG TPA: inosine/xanthosine triphosphatase [Candidatus Acidoferrum sp.]|nr:inosine/xanthosine triphosphatase [Candidatus Acidoferrum sp.]